MTTRAQLQAAVDSVRDGDPCGGKDYGLGPSPSAGYSQGIDVLIAFAESALAAPTHTLPKIENQWKHPSLHFPQSMSGATVVVIKLDEGK